MAKIKFDKWVFPFEIEILNKGYRIMGLGWYKLSSEHGKSKCEIFCPCCEKMTIAFIWSFMGGGKRCTTCNVFLGHGGAFLYKNELKENVLLCKNNQAVGLINDNHFPKGYIEELVDFAKDKLAIEEYEAKKAAFLIAFYQKSKGVKVNNF